MKKETYYLKYISIDILSIVLIKLFINNKSDMDIVKTLLMLILALVIPICILVLKTGHVSEAIDDIIDISKDEFSKMIDGSNDNDKSDKKDDQSK